MRVVLTTVGLPLNQDEAESEANAQEQGRSRQMELPEGATVKDLLERLEDKAQQVQKVLLNGAEAPGETKLQDGDAVALVGQTSGV